MDEPNEKIEKIFAAVLEISDLAERAACLRQACDGDELLRREVESLLAAHERAGTFLEDSAPGAPFGVPSSGVQVCEPDAAGTPTIAAPAPAEKPGDCIGRYKLLQHIGEGGFGNVWMADQEQPVRRRVALKIIKLGMDSRQVVARFEAERQTLAMLDHPNIARVLDGGATESGRPYFVMELVRGDRITEFCDTNRLPTEERLKFFLQICHAVQHAHQKGIIHRDLKPSNILVAIQDDRPTAKVIDFGIAKATDVKLTEKTLLTTFQQFLGTPAYMSPEQAGLGGLDIDTRSDIYSLGVLLYELLTGKTPFDTELLLSLGLDEMRRAIREKEPLRPSTRLSTLAEGELVEVGKHRRAEPPKLINLVRGDLDWIVLKCLEKDRTRRYETASGLAMDLQRHLSNEPVVARPPSRAYRFQKLVRRNKLVFVAATALTLVLMLGMLGTSWQALRATRAEREQSRLRRGAEKATAQEASARRAAEAAKAMETQQRQRAEAGEYAANMNLAQAAWEQNNAGRVRQLLEETAVYPGRGFEWYYWQRQTHLELGTLRGHLSEVRSVAYSPDGQRIVTGSSDRTVKVWEAASGRELLTLKGHRGSVVSVAFSPDGQRIVTGSLDQIAKVWEAASGRELLTLKGHNGGVMSVAFSPEGQRIVTGSLDQTAKVWESAGQRELLTLKGHSAWVNSVAFSPDGQRIVTGSSDQTAKVWEAASGQELHCLKGHSGQILSVAFSPDGQWIVTGSWDQSTKVWEAVSGRELLSLKGHNASVDSLAFSPDGQRIVTGSLDQTAKVWETASARELLTLKGHSGRIWSVAFSPDGQQIVTASWDQTAKVWEAASSRELLTLQTHRARVSSVAFSPDAQRIVTGSWDQTAKVWEAASGRELLTLNGHSREIWGVAFSSDGQRIVTGSADQTVKVWEAANGRELLTLKGHSGRVNSAAFSPDCRRIVSGSDDQTAKVWEAASGRELLTLKGHSREIWCVAFSPDGQWIATASEDRTGKVWEVASGRELITIEGHNASVDSVAFSPDGQRIVTGSADQTAKVWEAASGRELLTFKGHSGRVNSAAFSPDGCRIVGGSDDQTVKMWEAASGRELLTLKGHSGIVWSTAFSRDGQRIVTGSEDQTAKVWEAATSWQVAFWQEEKQAAAQRLADREREVAAAAELERALRAKDPGVLKEWLVLAPIAFAGGETGSSANALDLEQVPNVGQLRPHAGERMTVGAGEQVWQTVQLKDYTLDFNQLLGMRAEWSVAYAVCYVRSETDQSRLVMKVGSDDQSKLYLNGKEVYRHDQPRIYVPDQDEVTDIELKAGLNLVVFKVVNETLDWLASLRITDAAGQTVNGITVTLDPDGKPAP